MEREMELRVSNESLNLQLAHEQPSTAEDEGAVGATESQLSTCPIEEMKPEAAKLYPAVVHTDVWNKGNVRGLPKTKFVVGVGPRPDITSYLSLSLSLSVYYFIPFSLKTIVCLFLSLIPRRILIELIFISVPYSGQVPTRHSKQTKMSSFFLLFTFIWDFWGSFFFY